MAETYYATSEIVLGLEDGETKTFSEGEEVSKSDFSDEQFQTLVDGGSVSTDDSFLTETVATKTADVQALAQNRHRASEEFPAQENDPDKLDKQANESVKKETQIRSETADLSSDTRKAIAKLPAREQRNAMQKAQTKAAEEKLAGSSKSSGSKSSGGSTGSNQS